MNITNSFIQGPQQETMNNNEMANKWRNDLEVNIKNMIETTEKNLLSTNEFDKIANE